MDTLFRLVNFQSEQSINSSRTSSSSRSSRQTQFQLHQEECCNPYMDEDNFSSSSSSKHLYPYNHPTDTNATYASAVSNLSSSVHAGEPSQFTISRGLNSEFTSLATPGKWASDLLLQCANAVANKDSTYLQQLMWMLNELSSPYGDTQQKLAAYFLKALFCRLTDSGGHCQHTVVAVVEQSCSFEMTRKLVLKFQEVSPWTTFGHVASNGAIMEALEGEAKIHIVDISNTYCTQWPMLLEAFATRTDDAPQLRLTTIVATGTGFQKVMKEIGIRMEKFARLMRVPFKFNVLHHSGDLSSLNFNELAIDDDEAIAINCVGTLHSLPPIESRRDAVISAFQRLRPKIVTIVEDEADLNVGAEGPDFIRGFKECLRWFSVYFEALDESFPLASNERLALERAAGRALVDLIACPAAESAERREMAHRWSMRLRGAGFAPVTFSDDIADDVRALLRRYHGGWSMVAREDTAGVFLAWKELPVVWACAWKP